MSDKLDPIALAREAGFGIQESSITTWVTGDSGNAARLIALVLEKAIEAQPPDMTPDALVSSAWDNGYNAAKQDFIARIRSMKPEGAG